MVFHGSWSVFMVFMVFQGSFSWFWTLVLGCLLVLYMNDQILVHKYISSQNGLILVMRPLKTTKKRAQKRYLLNNIQSELNAGGAKRDCILHDPARKVLPAVGQLWPSDYDDDTAGHFTTMFVPSNAILFSLLPQGLESTSQTLVPYFRTELDLQSSF